LSVLGGAKPADALAEHEKELIDAADRVGVIRFHSHALPRIRSCVLGGSSGRSKNMPRSLLQNHKPLTLRLRSRARNDWDKTSPVSA
jgi:hypothetical protein